MIAQLIVRMNSKAFETRAPYCELADVLRNLANELEAAEGRHPAVLVRDTSREVVGSLTITSER